MQNSPFQNFDKIYYIKAYSIIRTAFRAETVCVTMHIEFTTMTRNPSTDGQITLVRLHPVYPHNIIDITSYRY